jgi:hypothetical protein
MKKVEVSAPCGGNTPSCTECGEWVHSKRWALGYTLCRACGEQEAKRQRTGWCISLAGHKQGYTLITDREQLKQGNKYANS